MVVLFTDRGITELRGSRISGKIPSQGSGDGFVKCTVNTSDFLEWEKAKSVCRRTSKIQGCCGVEGSMLVVPPHLKVFLSCDVSEKVELSCSTGLLKCAAAVLQLGFACFTLYRTRSSQVEEYGYAAFWTYRHPICGYVTHQLHGKSVDS
jgi:hypothetical protein